MPPRSVQHVLVRLIPLLLLLASPASAFGQPVAPDAPGMAPEARERLARAASDTLLPPWQRALMQRLARTGAAAGPEAAGGDPLASEPALAPEAADGAWSAMLRPAARAGHSAILDSLRNRMLVFGGDDNAFTRFGDVWALSLEGAPGWTRWTPDGTPPSSRSRHSAIYDPVRDRMVVFGGDDGTGVNDEVWVLSLSGTPAWTRLTPAGMPPAGRGFHGAVYDPVRDRMLVFGGHTDGAYLNDVWALSLSGTPTWTQLVPTGAPPAARWGHSTVYDPVRDRMVVFGGYPLGGQVLDDVWALSLADAPAWTELAPAGTSPGSRCGHSAVYDPVRDRMLVFGGDNVALNDTWALSLAGSPEWSQLAPAGALPGTRSGHRAVYDPLHDRMVVCGGVGSSYSVLGDVWALSLADAPGWAQLTPLTARYYHSTVRDPVRDRLVVFGGVGSDYSALDDVWALSLADAPAWTRLATAGTPPLARYAPCAVYDPVRDRMLIHGGYASGPGALGDLWALSLAGPPEWTLLAPAGTPPAARRGHSAIYDPVRDRVLFFGGYSSGAAIYNDVWALSLAGPPEWTQLTPSGGPPEARRFHSAVYDPVRDRMLVFGGSAATRLNDVWELSLAGAPAWTLLSPAGAPPSGRSGHGAVYDPVRDRMVVFGGYDTAVNDDVWALSLAGPLEWTELAPAGTSPSARFGHSATYDPERDLAVVIGGYSAAPVDDVWTLTWGDPALAGVSCPGEVVVAPGESAAASYSVTNPCGFAQTADYTLTSARDWPGFPITGSVAVGANGTVAIPLSVSVPDSAADGASPLIFGVTLRAVPQFAACAHDLRVDAATPVLLSLVSAVADPGRVRLTWHAVGSPGTATVYRSAGPGAWEPLGQVAPDGTGRLEYEDRAVSPGARYGYRLGLSGEDGEVFAGETWVDVPQAFRLALGGASPNPATRQLAVAFTLPDASAARLEAYDLAGRRVAARDVGPLGAGRHEVRLGEDRTLAPGVYLLRLTRGRETLVARAVIVR